MKKVTVTPPVFGSEVSYVNAVTINEDQDILWSRDSGGNIIGYTIINLKDQPPLDTLYPQTQNTFGAILEGLVETIGNIELDL